LLKEYKRPFDKISELIKQQKLIPVKRGIFVAGTNLGVLQPDRYLLANHLWGPSYVSLESALSHWGLIPERVFETVPVTMKRAKNYRTPVGRFTYLHAPLPYYSFGIRHIQLTSRQHAMIASPAKALCDKIIMTPGVNLRIVVFTILLLAFGMYLYFRYVNGWMEFRKNTDTPARFVSHTVIEKKAYTSDSIEILRELGILRSKQEDFFFTTQLTLIQRK
jgi:hypothetical protein